MCHERMSFALLLMYTFFAMPSKLDPWCPFYQVKAIWNGGLLILWWKNWQPLNFCVKSLNLHSCLVAKFNRVFSLFSYCKCYLVASTGFFFFFDAGGCELSEWFSLVYKLGHVYELLHVLVLFLKHLNSHQSKQAASYVCVAPAPNNLTTWLLWDHSSCAADGGIEGKCTVGCLNMFWYSLSVIRPFSSHTLVNYIFFWIYQNITSQLQYLQIHPACLFSLEMLMRFGLQENVGGCKYSDCFWWGLIKASVMGTFLTMNMRFVRNQWFLCWLINFVNLCWAFIQ